MVKVKIISNWSSSTKILSGKFGLGKVEIEPKKETILSFDKEENAVACIKKVSTEYGWFAQRVKEKVENKVEEKAEEAKEE